MTTASYTPTNTEPAYLRRFYRQLDDVRDDYFDALIVTGAPIETLPFHDVQYWDELSEIYQWSLTHCFRRLGICWGAQALMKLAYDVPKWIQNYLAFILTNYQKQAGVFYMVLRIIFQCQSRVIQ